MASSLSLFFLKRFQLKGKLPNTGKGTKTSPSFVHKHNLCDIFWPNDTVFRFFTPKTKIRLNSFVQVLLLHLALPENVRTTLTVVRVIVRGS